MKMKKSHLRLVLLFVSLVVVLVVTAWFYSLGMGALEGKPRGFWASLEWAAETLSTTGYGADSSWKHPAMVLFVTLVQFIGVFLVFLVFPIYLIPVLEERFETRLPAECKDARDHVIVFQHGPAVATLLGELAAAGVPTVVVEENEERARRLQEGGHRVVFGNLDEGVLGQCALDKARTLLVNSTDERNAAAIIAARQMGFTREILAVVETPLHRQPLMLAGATATYTPRLILGAALASRASRRVSSAVSGIQHLGSRLEVSESRIGRRSPMAGKTLAEAGIGHQTGVTVIGQWIGGKLVAPPTPGMRLEPGGILIVVGSTENIRRFSDACTGSTMLRRHGKFVVAGFGEVGRKVVELLHDAGEETCVISHEAEAGVDVVGNVIDPQVLNRADVSNAQAVVLALSSDQTTLLATVILKDLAPHVPVIARVNRAENVERIYGAGAEFAHSISQVSGQILAWRLLGKQAISLDPELKILKTSSSRLAGHHPADLRIRDRTGCSVVAIERRSELVVDFGPDFRFEDDDTVFICGSIEATRRFGEIFPSEPSEQKPS